MQTSIRTVKARVHREVFETTDYSIFSHLDGNREVNHLHVKRLMASIQEEYLETFIVVNEHYQIIDGQHRFECIKELGLPLLYVICEGYGLSQIHRFNQTVKRWTPAEYLQGYSDLGMVDYIQYQEFQQKYGFKHKENCLLLTGSMGKGTLERFSKGTFQVKDYKAACAEADKILSVGTYYKHPRRNLFVFTMHSLFKNPNFELKEFLDKLKKQPTALKDCTSIETYKDLIEEIYNYRRKEKVNLRFYNGGEEDTDNE